MLLEMAMNSPQPEDVSVAQNIPTDSDDDEISNDNACGPFTGTNDNDLPVADDGDVSEVDEEMLQWDEEVRFESDILASGGAKAAGYSGKSGIGISRIESSLP